MAVAVVDIWNLALQKLGAARLRSESDQSVGQRACSTCYDFARRAELRAHPWSFAIQRFQLPASATTPAFGITNSFPLPAGWLRVLPPDAIQNFNDRDWKIESGAIFTNDTAPLNVRCVMDIVDSTLMDSTFIEALACRMAVEMCEALTQSNEKQQNAKDSYKTAIREARKANAIEQVPQDGPEDTWVTARINGTGSGLGPKLIGS